VTLRAESRHDGRQKFSVIIQVIVETTNPDDVQREAEAWVRDRLAPSEVVSVSAGTMPAPVEVYR
jgi:hypothetical protein